VFLLESFVSLLSNPTRIFEFGGHLPCQNLILPRLVSATQKRARKSFFGGFLTFLGDQNCTKTQVHPWAYVTLHDKSRNAEFLSN